MAITKVTAHLDGKTSQLQHMQDVYSGNVPAPGTEGDYKAVLNVYDDTGNVAVVTRDITALEFLPPKTDWKAGDRFNIHDYNRILGNLLYLHKYGQFYVNPFTIVDMGTKLNSFAGYWKVSVFNAFEENVDIINRNILNRNYGIRQVFYENGPFIGFEELNRIERAILGMKESLDGIRAGIMRIPFRLGGYKEMRI